jgi:hypothetical protein
MAGLSFICRPGVNQHSAGELFCLQEHGPECKLRGAVSVALASDLTASNEKRVGARAAKGSGL